MAVQGNMLGVVEMANDESEPKGERFSAEVRQEAFQARFKDWVRPKDQWHTLDDTRMCVVLKGINTPGELELAAAKLQRVFREPHLHFGRPVPLSVKAGFAKCDDNMDNIPQAMQRAKQALAQAKRSSRMFELYSPAEVKDRQAEDRLLQRMMLALESGQYQLYYQPKVHAGFKNLIGAEALIRWHTPDGSVVTPNRFIDLAEKHDIIKPLTWWVIKSAVARLSRWPEELSIAVNISPRLLLDSEIISVVKDAVDIYGVRPARLTLEVTEMVMVDDQEIMLAELARLREMGFRIALDDFGTGFSSLAYFRDLPVDEIKIDQSFVMRMLTSDKDMAIVKAVIDLAHNFDMKVVAEGVDSNDIGNRLAEMRCDILQGFAFDKPLPVEDFERAYRIMG